VAEAPKPTLRDRIIGCVHDWAYAECDKPGVMMGKHRTLCFRRVCVKCEKREEISQYTYLYRSLDGQTYLAGPIWVDQPPIVPVVKL
jgi:hypothetical protein